jgi:hypothetical protein
MTIAQPLLNNESAQRMRVRHWRVEKAFAADARGAAPRHSLPEFTYIRHIEFSSFSFASRFD